MMACKKVRYRTRLDAKIALASTMAKNSAKRNEVRIYWCQECKGFHLTSQRKRT